MSRREFGTGIAALALGGWNRHGTSITPLNWSPTDVNPDITVSSAIASLNHDTGGGWVLGRSDRSQTFGTRYIEVIVVNDGDNNNFLRVGVGNGITDITGSSGLDTNSISYGSQGNVLYNSGFLASPPGSFTTGDTIGILLNFGAQTVQFNKNGGSFAGPYSVAAMGPELFLNYCFNSGGNFPSIQIGYSFKYPIPAGATPWNVNPVFPGATLNIVNHGDSLSLASAASSIYLPQLAALISVNSKGLAAWTRCGINGASWNYAWSGTGYPYTLTQDAPLRPDKAILAGIPNWLIAFAGTDGLDPFLGNESAATCYANFQTYIAARIAGVWTDPTKIIIPTCLPRTGLDETVRGDYNNLLVGGASTYGYQLARLDLNTTIGQAGDENNTTYYTGGVHPTYAGHAIIASIIYPLIFP